MVVYLETSIFEALARDNFINHINIPIDDILATKVHNLKFSSYREIPQSNSGGRSVSDRFHPSGEAGLSDPTRYGVVH